MSNLVSVLQERKKEKVYLDAQIEQFMKDSWVESIELEDIKSDLFELSALKELQLEAKKFKSDKDSVDRFKKLLSFDLALLKSDAEMLTSLTVINNNTNKLVEIKRQNDSDLEGAVAYLKAFRYQLKQAMIKDNLCPVCGQNAVGHEDHIVEEMAKLVK